MCCKSITIFICFVVLMIFTSLEASILLVVDSSYALWDNSDRRIKRYQQQVQMSDRLATKVIYFNNDFSLSQIEQCERLWNDVQNEYILSRRSRDTLTGVVLIGDLPVPIFYWYGEWYPVDYFYMDMWDTRKKSPYASWEDLWQECVKTDKYYITPQQFKVVSDTVFNRDIYKGDGHAEIWVSRVYAASIHNLRDSSVKKDEYLEEYEIIDRYLDRVHDRMTKNAKVPPRAMGMGHITQWFNDSLEAINVLKEYLMLDSLKLQFVFYAVNPQNNPSFYQSQLQAGPYGNGNTGAFQGNQFPLADFFKDNTNPAFIGDTRGYECVGIFEHSIENGHAFNLVTSNRSGFCLNGMFKSSTVSPAWSKMYTGGFADGSYYYCNKHEEKPIWGESGYRAKDKYSRSVTWNAVVPKPGLYGLYLYYESSPDLDKYSYLNIFVNDEYVYETRYNQSKHTSFGSIHSLQQPQQAQPLKTFSLKKGSNWEYIGSVEAYKSRSKISVRLHPSFLNPNPGVLPDRVIADALMIQHLSGDRDTIIVDNEDRTTGIKWFECDLWKERSLLSMIDDGGPSKTPFFIIQGCNVMSYNYTNCLGLLYAMAYEGLIAVGSSSPGWQSCSYQTVSKQAGNGKSFGDAFLAMVNEHMFDTYNTYVLVGAGTLPLKAYKPYIDSINISLVADEQVKEHERKRYSLYSKKQANLSWMHLQPGTTVQLRAGNEIKIQAEFKSARGSNLHLCVDSTLMIE